MPWPVESKQLSGFLWLARLLSKVSNWLLTPHREHRHYGGNILQGTYLSSPIYWICMNWNVSVHVIFQTGDQHVPLVVLAQLVFRMVLYIHLDRCHYFLFMVDQEDHYWFLLFGASVSVLAGSWWQLQSHLLSGRTIIILLLPVHLTGTGSAWNSDLCSWPWNTPSVLDWKDLKVSACSSVSLTSHK